MPLLFIPVVVPTGEIAFVWVDPGGNEHELDDTTGVHVLAGERGLGAPPLGLVEEKLPFAPGTLVRYAAVGSREIELPLHLDAPSALALQQLLDDVYAWFATADERTRTPGYLRVTRRDDAVRQVACYYAGGLEGDLGLGGASETWQDIVVTLKAPDPWATDVVPVEAAYDQADLGGTLGTVNYGHADAYPVWTISGPAANIAIRNTTTGKGFSLTANGGLSLATGDVLTVDTRPASMRTGYAITNQDGASLFSKLATGSANGSLWPLIPGSNNFTIEATGTSGDTSFGLAYLQRYRGVLR